MQLTDLKNEIEVFKTFGEFTETHEAIAAFRIKHLRNSVIQTRVFLTEIGDLYNLVKNFYFTFKGIKDTKPAPKKSFLGGIGSNIAGQIDKNSISFLHKNGKNVAVLLTSNTGFYGGILKNLFDDFIDYLSTNKCDVVIVGRAGKTFYEEKIEAIKKVSKTHPLANLPTEFTYFNLDDEKPTDQDISKIIDFSKNYDGIIIHYIQFFSVLTQIPYYSNIAGEVGLVGEADKVVSYVFEPSYEDILTFFETQILEAVFRQKVYEHQLARYGGKLVAMDDAVTSTKNQAEKLEKRSLRLKKQILNKKQQEVFSALLNSNETSY